MKPEPQSDDRFVICPHCEKKYQPETEDVSDEERTETCEHCGKTFIVWQDFIVTNYTRPTP